jgi:hypothetical protein
MTHGETKKIPQYNTRGAIVRLFGVILIILGSLNTMLSWRGGFELLSMPVILIIGGLLLCLIGSIMREIRA